MLIEQVYLSSIASGALGYDPHLQLWVPVMRVSLLDDPLKPTKNVRAPWVVKGKPIVYNEKNYAFGNPVAPRPPESCEHGIVEHAICETGDGYTSLPLFLEIPDNRVDGFFFAIVVQGKKEGYTGSRVVKP
ncbi:MAG: hypothetical protein HYZ81_14005 [Nitrospinae bacterium]|nr:hypothetical protein [Nitrospinota bacterium]